jgi:hypothetical protein
MIPRRIHTAGIHTAGNGARAHGARAKAGAKSFFLSPISPIDLLCALNLLNWPLEVMPCRLLLRRLQQLLLQLLIAELCRALVLQLLQLRFFTPCAPCPR